jgi:hypothetical protein
MIEFALRISVARNLIYSLEMALEMKTQCAKCATKLTFVRSNAPFAQIVPAK